MPMRISGVTYVTRKTHTAKNIVKAIAVILILACLAVAAISLYSAWALLHPEKEAAVSGAGAVTLEHKNIEFRDIGKDIVLKGWLFDPAGKSGRRRLVILVHDYGKDRLQFGMQTLDLIRNLEDKNCDVMAFDMRNSGLSGGSRSTFGAEEKGDVLGAVKYAVSNGYKDIVLFGFGTGASASLLAAASGGTGQMGHIDAVIADSPYSDLKSYLDGKLPVLSSLPVPLFNGAIAFSVRLMSGLDISGIKPIEGVASLPPKPVLFISGTDDRITPVSVCRSMYNEYEKAGGSCSRVLEIRGAGHLEGYTHDKAYYTDQVGSFLDNAAYGEGR